MPKRGPSELYVLEPAHVRQVVASAQDLEERILVKCPLYLGLRVSELVHLRQTWLVPPKEVRVPASQWCACADCLKRGGEWEPKTRAGARIIPVTEPLREDLLAFLHHHPNGLEMSRFIALRKIKRVLKRAGVQNGFAHALRATCATMLASAGLNAAQLCYVMGWSSLETAAHYIRIAAARKDAAEAMERAFK